MKLESLATKSRRSPRIEPVFQGNILKTTPLLHELFENKGKVSHADLAHLAHTYLAEGLANLALKEANTRDVKFIGFTGGVAYNEIITSALRHIVESSGLKFLVHEAVPPGDGGTSFGQAVVTGFHEPIQ
jgi:hydrogenase maturation protein HypF